MTGAELIGCTVYDVHGQPLGRVHDLRFAAGGRPSDDSGTPAYELTALESGGGRLAHHLGYTRHGLAGPWLLTVLLRRLARRSLAVPYSAVTRAAGLRIPIALAAVGPPPATRAGESGTQCAGPA